MAAILQTLFSNAFSWMKMYEFRLRFHWSLFLKLELTALVQIMAWHRPGLVGAKPLSEPMIVSLLTHICVTWPQWVNSLAPVRFEWNSREVIFKLISVIDSWITSCEIALRCMSLDLTDDKSRLVQVMSSCYQATNHYLSEGWPRSMSSYGVTRPPWDKQ